MVLPVLSAFGCLWPVDPASLAVSTERFFYPSEPPHVVSQEVLVPRQPSDLPLRHLTSGFAHSVPSAHLPFSSPFKLKYLEQALSFFLSPFVLVPGASVTELYVFLCSQPSCDFVTGSQRHICLFKLLCGSLGLKLPAPIDSPSFSGRLSLGAGVHSAIFLAEGDGCLAH